MSVISFAEAVRGAIASEMERDPSVYCLGIDIGVAGGIFGVTAGLQDQFGKKRVRDTPITESVIVGCGVGSAVAGLRPIMELMFVDFIGVSLDQLMNQAAKMRYMFGGRAKVPLVLRTCYGAGLGAAAQHSQSLESIFMHIPGIKVIIPSTPYDAKGLLISAIQDDNPVVFLEHKALYFSTGEVPEESYTIPIGKADIKKQGNDLTLVATGQMVPLALGVAETLGKEDIDIEVIDPRSLLPLDEETILASVRKTHRLLVVHEEVEYAGSGAEIAAMVADKAFDDLDAPVKRIGGPFCPVPFSSILEKAFIPKADNIIKTIKEMI